jgi:hypothetical protein
MDILNSPECTDKIETLFPAQRVRLFSPKLTVSMFMAQSAFLADITPRKISFKLTVQRWIAWQGRHDEYCCFIHPNIGELFILIAQQQVGKRPGRIEPRAVKYRPKPFPFLTQPRTQAREEVRENSHPKKLK